MTLNFRTIWLWTWVKYYGSVPGQHVSISLNQGKMPWFPARAKHGSVSEQNTISAYLGKIHSAPGQNTICTMTNTIRLHLGKYHGSVPGRGIIPWIYTWVGQNTVALFLAGINY
jgi:hypothetical protein